LQESTSALAVVLAALAAAIAGCTCEGPANVLTTGTPAPANEAPATATAAARPPATKGLPLAPEGTARPDFDELRRPAVTLADLSVTGALDAENARAAVAARLPEASACLANRLDAKPGLRGLVEVNVAFDAAAARPLTKGTATAVHSGGDAVLEACLAAIFASWTSGAFAAAAPGPADLRFHLTLYGGLKLPATMPALPPPPPLPAPARPATAG
jgi:hypothetical protein